MRSKSRRDGGTADAPQARRTSSEVCPVEEPRLPRRSWAKMQLPRSLYWVWKSPLQAAVVSGMLAIVSFAIVPLAAGAAQADCNKPGVYCNPIAVDSFPALITTIATAVVKIGGPLAAAAIVFVGIRFVIAAASGDQAGLTKARTMLWYVLIGTVIIVGGSALAEAVVKFIQNPTG